MLRRFLICLRNYIIFETHFFPLQMMVDESGETLTVETLDFLAKPVSRTFRIDEISEPGPLFP